MARRKMGAISTGEMIGIGLAGLAVLYLVMNKKTTTTTPTIITTTAPGTTAINNPYAAQASTTNTIANDSENVLDTFINALND